MKALLPFMGCLGVIITLGLSARAQELPREIKVGKEVYVLEEVAYIDEGVVGDTDTKAKMVRILRGQKPEDARDTLLHELLHVSADQSGREYLKKKRLEEDFVQRMTPRLLLILRDNPKILDYLLGPAT